MPKGSDPPIIVTGGGGDGLAADGKPTKNVISVTCDPEDPKSPKRFKTKINKHADITSVLLEFPDMPGQNPIEISGYDVYNIKITFNTDEASRHIKPKPDKRKKKKAPAKRPAAKKGK